MSQDVVSDCLNQIMNAKRAGKEEVEIVKSSIVLEKVLDLMKKLKLIDYKKDKTIKIKIKDISECRAIKPRYNVKYTEIDGYVRRFLPSRNMGFILISTSKGLMIHEDALKNKLGGSLMAYAF